MKSIVLRSPARSKPGECSRSRGYTRRPAASGAELCSGDMLLEALVACAGVTLKAVATALDIPLRRGTVKAEGDLDFRGTLGVSKEAPVGFGAIRLRFEVESDASQAQLDTLLKLTERYCVVFQTLNTRPGAQGRTEQNLGRRHCVGESGRFGCKTARPPAIGARRLQRPGSRRCRTRPAGAFTPVSACSCHP